MPYKRTEPFPQPGDDMTDPKPDPNVTPESLRTHANWLRESGFEAEATMLRQLSEQLESDLRAAEAKNRKSWIIDHIGIAFMKGANEANPYMPGWKTLSHSERRMLGAGLAAALASISDLDPQDLPVALEMIGIGDELTDAIIDAAGPDLESLILTGRWFNTLRTYAPDKAVRLAREQERLVTDDDKETPAHGFLEGTPVIWDSPSGPRTGTVTTMSWREAAKARLTDRTVNPGSEHIGVRFHHHNPYISYVPIVQLRRADPNPAQP